ncbi:uncharacterized protein LOC136029731 [Artemia franciscana]|uniref:uncharacterized protein LOC136029731 n=1 Tax=Artemia franciscana TaxID=6661 RepID=UPI0032DADAF7
MILLIRFKEASNEQRHENQHRFHSSPLSYSTTVQTLQLPVINMFLGFVTAFTSVTHESLWKITVEDGMLVKFIQLLKAYYENCKANVRVLGEVKQGCTLSPVLFNYCTDWVLERKLLSLNGVIMGSGINMSDLDYTDDIVALAADLATAQEMLKDIACLSQLLDKSIGFGIMQARGFVLNCPLLCKFFEFGGTELRTIVGGLTETHLTGSREEEIGNSG